MDFSAYELAQPHARLRSPHVPERRPCRIVNGYSSNASARISRGDLPLGSVRACFLGDCGDAQDALRGRASRRLDSFGDLDVDSAGAVSLRVRFARLLRPSRSVAYTTWVQLRARLCSYVDPDACRSSRAHAPAFRGSDPCSSRRSRLTTGRIILGGQTNRLNRDVRPSTRTRSLRGAAAHGRAALGDRFGMQAHVHHRRLVVHRRIGRRRPRAQPSAPIAARAVQGAAAASVLPFDRRLTLTAATIPGQTVANVARPP